MESIKTYTTLTKDRLIELEQKEKTSLELLLDFLITIGPLLACALAILEYLLLPNARENDFVHRYVVLLLVPVAIYTGEHFSPDPTPVEDTFCPDARRRIAKSFLFSFRHSILLKQNHD